MMAWLSSGLGWALSIPALVLMVLTFAHQAIGKHDARVAEVATTRCETKWMVALSKQQTMRERERANHAQAMMEEGQRINEGLTNELEQIRVSYAAASSKANQLAADLRDNCVSPGVLDALRRRHGVGGG
jgi:hypothetical protein